MFNKKVDYYNAVACILKTLQLRDPKHQTILIGSSSVDLQLASKGYKVSYIDDVDVLCPDKYFNQLLKEQEQKKLIRRRNIAIRQHKIKTETEFDDRIIDINPNKKDVKKGILPFSAHLGFGSTFYPIIFNVLNKDERRVVKTSGIRCLNIKEILIWKSIVGREKDLEYVKKMQPIAYRLGLINDNENSKVLDELNFSIDYKERYPERYYARLNLVV